MIRYLSLYLLYLSAKIRYCRSIRFNGFTVYFAIGKSQIQIGKGSVFNSSSLSNLLGLYQRCIIVARHGGQIKIGKNCGVSGSTIYAMEKIEIGDNCLIGANCKIIDNDFHPLDKNLRKQNKTEDIAKKEVFIGKDCFIGMNSIILKGTRIGDNCIIGAGSVVSGTFPDNVIVAGNPAKIIKHLQ